MANNNKMLIILGLGFVFCLSSSILGGVGYTQGWFDSLLGKTSSGTGTGTGSGSGTGTGAGSGTGTGTESLKASGAGASASNTCTQWYYDGPIADNAAAQGGVCSTACKSYKPTSSFTGQWTNEGQRGCECKWTSTDACPTGDAKQGGYTFYPFKDSAGSDLNLQAAMANNSTGLKAYCSANPLCKGFNTNGWTKTAIQPSAQWSNFTTDSTKGLYVKN